jgi:Ca2+-binding EF-hand superfamily protein
MHRRVGPDRFSQVRSNLLKSVSKCGARGCFSLKRQLQAYDRDDTGSLDREELYAALTDFKLGVSEDDIEAIFIQLDSNGDDVVDFYELLQIIAPRMTHDRNAIVMQAFNKVLSSMLGDADVVDAKVLRDSFDATQHPDVLTGDMNKEQAHIEFLDTFNDMFPPREMVRASDFKGYYQLISAGIASDQQFHEMVGACWGVVRPRVGRRRGSVGSTGARPKSPGRWGRSPSKSTYDRSTYDRSPGRRASYDRPSGRAYDKYNALDRDRTLRRESLAGGLIEVEVLSGNTPGFQLSDLLTVSKVDEGSEVELANVKTGMVLKAFQEQSIDETEAGNLMLREIRATPLPWLFCFGPAPVPWSTDPELKLAPDPHRPEIRMPWGQMGQQHAGPARDEGLSVDAIMAKVKHILESRGSGGIAGLARSFSIMDDDGTGDLSISEFTKAMNDYRVGLNAAEIDAIFEEFDIDMSGGVSYEEFLRALRGKMNLKRKSAVQAAFRKFDSDGSGEVTIADLEKSGYSAKDHPDVKSGKYTERKVLMDMLSRFEGGVGDGYVTEEEFIDYYARSVSPSIDNDDHFVLLVRKAWRLDETSVPEYKTMKGKSGENPLTGRNLTDEMDTKDRSGMSGVANIDDDITMKKLRETPQLMGARNQQALKTHFANFDRDRSGDLDLTEFQRALREFQVRLSSGEVRRVFALFDDDRSGAIKYEEFMQGLVGGATFSAERQAVVQEAFDKFDHDRTGIAKLSEVQDGFASTAHPDAKSGKKQAMQVQRDFIDAVDPTKSGNVTIEKFSKYFAALSREIEDDAYFEVRGRA